jgi:hypothetical protein
MFVQSDDAITKVNRAAPDNEHRWSFVFLLEVVLNEVAIKDLYTRRGSEVGMGEPSPVMKLNLELAGGPSFELSWISKNLK